MVSAPSSFIARKSTGRLILHALGAAGFVIIGLWMIGAIGEIDYSRGRRFNPAVIPYVGWFSILFFGLAFVIIVRRIFSSKPLIQIDQEGIEHWQIGRMRIGWDEIIAAEVRHFSVPMLLYGVSQQKLESLSLWRRGLAWLNRKTVGYSFALSVQGTNMSMDDVMRAVEQYSPDGWKML